MAAIQFRENQFIVKRCYVTCFWSTFYIKHRKSPPPPHNDVIKWKHYPRDWSFVWGISQVTGEFPIQRPVSRRCDIFSDLRLNERLSKQSWGWWFETPSHPSWCHSNAYMRTRTLTSLYPRILYPTIIISRHSFDKMKTCLFRLFVCKQASFLNTMAQFTMSETEISRHSWVLKLC